MRDAACLIALVGMDGTGKSVQSDLLRARLEREGYDARYAWSRWEPRLLDFATRYVREPEDGGAVGGADEHPDGRPSATTGRLGRKRAILAVPGVRSAWTSLALLDYRLFSLGELGEARRCSSLVVVDRYVHDFLVDQAMNVDGRPETLRRLRAHPLLRFFAEPAVTLVLDLDPAEAARRKDDGTTEDYLSPRRRLYASLADSPDTFLVDASGTTEDVHDALWSRIAPTLREV